jgi:hypothetical protein
MFLVIGLVLELTVWNNLYKILNYGQELTFWVEQTSAVILFLHFSWFAEAGVVI